MTINDRTGNDVAGKQRSCPDSDLLNRLVSGQLDSDAESALISHLDQCADCQNALDQQAANSNYAKRLPSLQTSDADSSVLNEALQDLKSGHGPRSEAVASPPDLSGNPAEEMNWNQDGFEFVRRIGSGGMGVVSLSREISLDRMVAIKLLSPILAADETAHTRFLREARAAAAVSHQNVITIFAVIDRTPLPYLVMEYVDGESLQERIDRTGPVDLEETVRIGLQVADGLAAAHAKGVVHRDVKPANVLIESGSGNVKLSDFGLARVTGQSKLTRTGIVVGTPAFMAPELFEEDEKCDHRADLFSLGSLLYAMRTGASPFASDSVWATLHRIASVDPKPLAEVAPDTPTWFAGIVERLLDKDPDNRFQSAGELTDALRSGAQEQRQSATTSPSQSRRIESKLRPPARRKPTPRAFWIGLFIAGLFSVTAYTVWNSPNAMAAKFLVSGDDGEPVGSYGTLAKALDEAPNFARIQIHGNGPFALTETFIEQTELTIAAAAGFQPVIRFKPEEFLEEESSEDEFEPMLTFEGKLMLEGIEIEYLSDEEHDARPLVRIDEGELFARRCRFTNTSEAGCLVGEATNAVSLTACDLRCAEGCAIALSLEDEAALIFDGCLISGWGGIELELGEACSLTLNRCTIVAARVLEVSPDEERLAEDDAIGLKVSAAGTVLQAREGILTITTAEVTADNFAELVHWRGSRNLFSGPLLLVDGQDEEQPPKWLTSFADWNSLCDELNSAELAEPFVTRLSDSWGLLQNPNRLDPASFRLRDAKESKEKIGVNLDSLLPTM